MQYVLALLCLSLSLISNPLLAQLTAGEIPLAYSLHQSDVRLEVEDVQAALDLIDLNFDGENDLKFQIVKSANGARSASIFSESDQLGICHIQGLNYTPAEIYEEGGLLICADSAGFDLNPALVGIGLGRFDNGSVDGFPAQITNGYLHYEWETETALFEGWIRISFDLSEEVIFLTVQEWIIKDEVSSTQILDTEGQVSLFPNPVQNGVLYCSSEQNLKGFEIYNLQGQLLKRGVISGNEIPLGQLRGMVVVQLQTEEGRQSKKIFIE